MRLRVQNYYFFSKDGINFIYFSWFLRCLPELSSADSARYQSTKPARVSNLWDPWDLCELSFRGLVLSAWRTPPSESTENTSNRFSPYHSQLPTLSPIETMHIEHPEQWLHRRQVRLWHNALNVQLVYFLLCRHDLPYQIGSPPVAGQTVLYQFISFFVYKFSRFL